MPRFDPRPGDLLTLFGEGFTVQPHPRVPSMRYAAEARKAVVYQVASIETGQLYALKVFKPKYRTPDLEGVPAQLWPFGDLPGLRAARRRVVPPSEPAVAQLPDLEYAMLMPWIQGRTWYDLLLAGRDGRERLPWDTAVRLCEYFLRVLVELEARGIAHTDVSPGNVVIDLAALEVELLDLEDLYLPEAPSPHQGQGSPGYRHPAGNVWCKEGDRYAGAVLAAEILLLSNRGLARLATDEGYFVEDCRSALGQERFAKAESWLRGVAPEFLKVFRRSWSAPTLAECPPLWELHAAAEALSAGKLEPVPRLLPSAGAPAKRLAVPAWALATLIFFVLALAFVIYAVGPAVPALPLAPDLPAVASAPPRPSPPAVTPKNLWKFQTTFVGSREIATGHRETLVLEIRGIRGGDGQSSFDYTLNTAGLRLDNLGTLSLSDGRVDLPDLGAGRLFFDAESRPALEGVDPPPAGRWELREAS